MLEACHSCCYCGQTPRCCLMGRCVSFKIGTGAGALPCSPPLRWMRPAWLLSCWPQGGSHWTAEGCLRVPVSALGTFAGPIVEAVCGLSGTQLECHQSQMQLGCTWKIHPRPVCLSGCEPGPGEQGTEGKGWPLPSESAKHMKHEGAFRGECSGRFCRPGTRTDLSWGSGESAIGTGAEG